MSKDKTKLCNCLVSRIMISDNDPVVTELDDDAVFTVAPITGVNADPTQGRYWLLLKPHKRD